MLKTRSKHMMHKLVQTKHDVNMNGLDDDVMQHLIHQLIQKIDSLHSKVDTLSNKLNSTFKEPVQTQAGRCVDVDQLKVQDRHDSDLESTCSRHSIESDESGHVVVTFPDGCVEPRSKANRTKHLTTTDFDLRACGITSNLPEPCHRLISEQKKKSITYVREIDSLHANVDTLSNILDSPFKEPVQTQAWRFLGVDRKVRDQRDSDLASECSRHSADSDDSGYVRVTYPSGHFEPRSKGNRTKRLTTTNFGLRDRRLNSKLRSKSKLTELRHRLISEPKKKQKKKRITYVQEIDSLHANSDTLSNKLESKEPVQTHDWRLLDEDRLKVPDRRYFVLRQSLDDTQRRRLKLRDMLTQRWLPLHDRLTQQRLNMRDNLSIRMDMRNREERTIEPVTSRQQNNRNVLDLYEQL